jgi:integrase
MINKEAFHYMKLWTEKRGYDHEYIFTTKYGGEIKQMSDSWADDFCANTLSDILERRINPHIFKASCISLLLEQGVPLELVSKLVAQHNDISTTVKHYDLRDFAEEKNKIFDWNQS